MRLKKYKLAAATILAAFVCSMIPASLVRAEEGMFTLDKIVGLPLAQKELAESKFKMDRCNFLLLAASAARNQDKAS